MNDEGKRCSTLVRTVYLDTNHWIELARAAHGRPDHPAHVGVLALLRSLAQGGELQLPLSWFNYLEVHQCRSIRRRRRVARLMTELSRGLSLAPLTACVATQLPQSVARFAGLDRVPPTVLAIGRGVGHAFGMQPVSRFDATALFLEPMLAAEPEGLDQRDLRLADEVLRELKVRSEARAREMEDGREWAQNDSSDASQRYHLARQAINFRPVLIQALRENALRLDSSHAAAQETLTAIIRGVPELSVRVALSVARDLQRDRRIVGNDLRDIDALSVAIPNCDFIVTEKFWASLCKRKASGVLHGDRVLGRLDDLARVLTA